MEGNSNNFEGGPDGTEATAGSASHSTPPPEAARPAVAAVQRAVDAAEASASGGAVHADGH
eukprot:4854255-Alexandrium_andersonii.AAC.1